jgi:hypothetical protein
MSLSYAAEAGAAEWRACVNVMLAIAIQIPEARNAKKPAGVKDKTPSTTPAQPSHFAKPP